jgi:type IV pilus assembly protein PilE
VKNAKGFTLIEVMIVVAIVAILAAVAVPSYKNSIQKTRRAEAKEALTRIAAAQERFFFTNNRYANMAEITQVNPYLTENGHYSVTRVCSGACPATSFLLQAVARNSQLGDTDCGVFYIDHVGRKTSKRQASDAGYTTDVCW